MVKHLILRVALSADLGPPSTLRKDIHAAGDSGGIGARRQKAGEGSLRLPVGGILPAG